MLGDLARDLRFLGFDAACSQEEDAALLVRARAERRVLLTRDKELAQRAGADGRLVPTLPRDAAPRAVLATLGLRPDPAAFLSRCAECNTSLEGGPKGARCPGCGRVYWDGSHVAALRRRFADLLAP